MSTAPEGWYPDPHEIDDLRWWDGELWTRHTRSREEAVTDNAWFEPDGVEALPSAESVEQAEPEPTPEPESEEVTVEPDVRIVAVPGFLDSNDPAPILSVDGRRRGEVVKARTWTRVSFDGSVHEATIPPFRRRIEIRPVGSGVACVATRSGSTWHVTGGSGVALVDITTDDGGRTCTFSTTDGRTIATAEATHVTGRKPATNARTNHVVRQYIHDGSAGAVTTVLSCLVGSALYPPTRGLLR